MRRLQTLILGVVWVVGAVGCGDDDTAPGNDGGGNSDGVPSLSVAGTVVDFETEAPVSGSATVSTQGITPPPNVSVMGADFDISGIPPYSVFFILSGSPPDYRNTYNTATTVDAVSLTDVQAYAVSEAYLAELQTAFGVNPTAGTGILLVQAVDTGGAARAGIATDAFTLNGAPALTGPFVLDATKQPAPGDMETSSSGWLVYFDVPAGTVRIGATDPMMMSVDAPDAPVSINTVSVAKATVSDSMTMLPTNVSFANQLMDMFDRRGCATCHSGNGPGRDLGGLTLDGGSHKVYTEITQELSPNDNILRVDLMNPENSLMLTMPGQPVDRHPNITFASSTDADYLLLLVWIREGAQEN